MRAVVQAGRGAPCRVRRGRSLPSYARGGGGSGARSTGAGARERAPVADGSDAGRTSGLGVDADSAGAHATMSAHSAVPCGASQRSLSSEPSGELVCALSPADCAMSIPAIAGSDAACWAGCGVTASHTTTLAAARALANTDRASIAITRETRWRRRRASMVNHNTDRCHRPKKRCLGRTVDVDIPLGGM